MRELSIRLFQVVMGLTESTTKKVMKKEVRDSLLPLLFHLHDQDMGEAKVGFPTWPALWAVQFGPFRCVPMSSSLLSS